METWDERYASGKYSSAEPHKILLELAEKLTAGKALDLACGAGRNAIFLAGKGWQVMAVDNSKIGIEIARNRAAEKNLSVDFRVADLETGEFEIEENAYDLICDFYYLQRDLFPKIKAGVKAGGIVVAAIHIYGAGEEAGRFMLREGELAELFEDFKILRYHETALTDADAGEHHRRTAEIVARRRK
jgi:tellurite methyltransferase